MPGAPSVDLFTGTRQGLLAVFRRSRHRASTTSSSGPTTSSSSSACCCSAAAIGRLLKIVTAFTLAHTVTLVLATLQIVNPPSRIIEPAIALSIVYVGVENLLAGARPRRARLDRVRLRLRPRLRIRERAARVRTSRRGARRRRWSRSTSASRSDKRASCSSRHWRCSLVRQRDAVLAGRIATAGSVGVMIAGAYWFFERVF